MSDNVASGAIPSGDLSGLAILDIGCGDGWRFDLPEFEYAKRLAGIDPDKRAINIGQFVRPHAELVEGVAERIPFGSEEFDVCMSIVSLPYTNIPSALKEVHRVLKPGGRAHITMHDMQMQLKWLWRAVKGMHIKRVIDHGYIAVHSAWFALTGRCFPRPWKWGTYESFQTQRRMLSLVEKAGFTSVQIRRTARHFVVEAIKPV